MENLSHFDRFFNFFHGHPLSSSISVTVDVLAEHRMYAYVTADTYKTKVPWKGKMTKVYWNGDREVEDVEGIYEAIKIMDINVNYGRMTPLSQSAFEDNGASKEGVSEVNMLARDRHLPVFSKKTNLP